MSYFQDQEYNASEQYKDASNLNSFIQLHQRVGTNPYVWFSWVIDQFNLPSKPNILEIACGPGRLWLDNQDRIPTEWSINLSDFSQGMVRECQVNFGNNQKAFTFDVLNAMEIPFPDGTFDAAIANHMLYCIPDRCKALADIARVLKPDGHFYATTNGENHLRELSEIINLNMSSIDKRLLPTLSTDEFSLENGTEQLASWFKQIQIRRYEDSLVVTEVEPLVKYIYSMIPRSDNPAGKRHPSHLHRSINEMIIQQGSIYIQKSTGIFIGEKRG